MSRKEYSSLFFITQQISAQDKARVEGSYLSGIYGNITRPKKRDTTPSAPKMRKKQK